ncbi:TIGR03067 domain-containing protein [bacterium]|nr:TIGR03067 domain-containing protein [bacterium]
MKTLLFGLLFVGVMVTIANADGVNTDGAKDEAIKKDRQQIEGTWRIVQLVINGNPAKEEDARKLIVVNGNDGTWSLRSADDEITKGTSTFDPTQKPKTIDFTPSVGDIAGKLYLGIYELGSDVRRLCFAPPEKERPTEFTSEKGSEHILVKFERVKSP